MLDIKTLALVLLIGRIIAVTFIILVLIKQWRLIRLPLDERTTQFFNAKDVLQFRVVFFVIGCIILAINFVPILIDTITFFADNVLGRNPKVPPISAAYALSNSFGTAILSAFVWLLYRLAEGRLPRLPWMKKQ